MPPTVWREKCTGCGTCLDVCPARELVFQLRSGLSYVVNPESCVECGACELECPERTITL